MTCVVMSITPEVGNVDIDNEHILRQREKEGSTPRFR